MSKKIDLTGQKFGRLTVLYEIGPEYRGTAWCCKCECGNLTVGYTSDLRAGNKISCGCYREWLEVTQGGRRYAKLYNQYLYMRRKCENPGSERYDEFGGKGIVVCNQWRENVWEFIRWALKSKYYPGDKLFRRNIESNFDPKNCYWYKENDEVPDNHRATPVQAPETHQNVR